MGSGRRSPKEAGGPDWHAALERALGVEGDEADVAAGAVELFRMLSEDVRALLDDWQRDVIADALATSR